MIGFYVHHHGNEHLHRALAVSRAFDRPVTGLSSLERPVLWPGAWVRLDRDDEGDTSGDPTVRGRVHWAPRGHPGLRSRMAEIAAWISHLQPSLLVVDGSVEVSLLARLHGVPVVSVVAPGHRGDDAHRLGFDVADALVAFWPAEAQEMLLDVPASVLRRIHPVGALSRFDEALAGRAARASRAERREVALIRSGRPGSWSPELLQEVREQTPGWTWTVVGQAHARDETDEAETIRRADVVVTHAGQGALADVAALRRPAVVVPEPSPHDEQRVTAEVLRRAALPVLVTDQPIGTDWAERLTEAAALDGEDWARWCDGDAIGRLLDVVRATAKVEPS